MKSIYVFWAAMSSFVAAQAQSACPVNFDSDSLAVAKTHLSEWTGKTVAFQATVQKIESLKTGEAYVECLLVGGDRIWASLPVQNKVIQKSSVLRILGFFQLMDEDWKKQVPYNRDSYEVIGIAQINIYSKHMTAMPGAQIQYQEWMNGKVPVSKP